MVRTFLTLAASVVLAGLLTPAPAVAEEPGAVSGTVAAESSGQPVPGACVTAFDLDLNEVGSACAAADGRYEIAGIEPGAYKVRASAAGYADLWSYRKGSALAADVAYLPGTLDFALRQGSGVVRGRITDQDAPVAGARVHITDVHQQWWSAVETAADGTYAFTGLTPDSYQLEVSYGGRSQWVPQKASVFDAGVYPVADGQVTVVDEALLPYKSLRVSAVDESTGAPVADACSSLYGSVNRQVCAGPDGVMRYDELPPLGYYSLSVWAGTHWGTTVDPVSLSPGEVTDLRVELRPAAAIVTTVRDAKTKAPLENICVETHDVPVVGVIDRDYTNFCTDASGSLTIGPVDPGKYQLLVKPFDERYGMQWVGRTGGTGDLRKARIVTAELGARVSIPPIEMDPAGTITGVVTDRATGSPVNLVCVYPYAVDPRIGLGFGQNCSRNGGTYTIGGLGPYAWPLEFFDSQGRYAIEWSGSRPDRFAAVPVRVRPNATTTANATLVPGGSISGRTLNQQGQPDFGYVYTYNARTGDILDSTTPPPDGTGQYTIAGLATQDVKIQYYVEVNCWHHDATDFASATPVHVTAGETTAGVDLGPCHAPGRVVK